MVTYTTEPTYYDTARDWLAEDDHIEMDISVEGWSRTLRIRDLSIPQRERINRYAGVGDKRDWEKWHAMTLVEGVVRPRLTPTEAAELAAYHNGQSVEELSEAIWNVGGLHTTYQRYKEELKALENAKRELAAAEPTAPSE